MNLTKPPRLQQGDTVAAISLSSGAAHRFPHRYEAGKRQLAETFDLNVVETPHALRSDDWLYQHPQARADDLHWALTNPNIKAIISIIGGYESVRILPFLKLDLILRHPKIFMGLSDTTITLSAFLNAGVTAFHGPAIMSDLAENAGIHPFVEASLRQTLFEGDATTLNAAPVWTEEFLDWGEPELQNQQRTFLPNEGWRWLQGEPKGESKVEGHLIGGNIEVLEMLKGTRWWPVRELWEGAVLMLETSEEVPRVGNVEYWLRNYASQGIMQNLSGLLLARPMGYSDEMKTQLYAAVQKVLAEVGREDMPVVANMDFGHTSPQRVLPLGGRVEIDAEKKRVRVLESPVS